MKKYLGLILSAVILLSSIAVNAETNTPKTTEEAVMSVELIENNALEEDIQESEIDKSDINSVKVRISLHLTARKNMIAWKQEKMQLQKS